MKLLASGLQLYLKRASGTLKKISKEQPRFHRTPPVAASVYKCFIHVHDEQLHLVYGFRKIYGKSTKCYQYLVNQKYFLSQY